MRKSAVIIVVLLCIAVAAGLFGFNQGYTHTILTTDSIVYVDTARHIARGEGVTFSILDLVTEKLPRVQTQWPPFSSMTMAPLIAAGVEPIFAGRIVSAVSLGLLALLAGLWLWRLVGWQAGILGAVLVPSLPALSSTSAAVWSDSLYAVLVLGVVWIGTEILQRPTRLRWFSLGALTGIAILTKFLGLILLGIVALFLVWQWARRGDLRTTVVHAAWSGFGIALFVLPMLARNLLVRQPIGGAQRTLSTMPIWTILHDLVNTVTADLTSSWLWRSLLALVTISVLLLAIDLRHGRKPKRGGLLVLLTAVIIAFFLGLAAARLAIDTDPIHTRFVMPIYAVVIVLFILVMNHALVRFRRTVSMMSFMAIALIAAVGLAKDYAFRHPTDAVNVTSRARWVQTNTTDRDLSIGNIGPEFTLYLGRTSMRIRTVDKDPALTPGALATLWNRWHGTFDHLYLTISPNLSAGDYGDFMAKASRGVPGPASLRLVTRQPSIVVYEISGT